MPFFHIVHGALMGQSVRESWASFQSGSLALDARMWMIYIPSNTILFMYIPNKYQIVWTSTVALLWNVVLSLYTHALNRSVVVSAINGLNRFGTDKDDWPGIGTLVSDLYPFG